MADAAKEATKEKPKKKKSESKKSEAKKASISENSTEGAETVQKAGSRKASATPDAEATEKSTSRKQSATPETEATEKPPSRKQSATPETESKDKTERRKSSATPDTGILIEEVQVPEIRKSSIYEEEHVPQELKDAVSTYKPPPAATKKDVELLEDLDESKLLELKEAFELFDLNHDGIIDLSDLRNTYMTLGKKPEEVDEKEIQHMLSEAIHPLDFDSFVVLLGYKTIELDPEEILQEALSKWDYDGSGLISEDRIKHDLMTWGDKFTPEEVDMALEDAPTFVGNKEVMIDYAKFCKILCGLRKKTKAPGPEDFMKH